MLGYYYNGKPFIYKIDLAVCRCDRELSWYAVSGCGSSLGSFLLQEYGTSNMSLGVGSIVAGYVVEKASEHIRDCCPPAKVGVFINDLAAYHKESYGNTEVHPTFMGAALIIISTRNNNDKWAKRLQAAFDAEKKSTVKRFQKIIQQGSKEGRELGASLVDAKKSKNAKSKAFDKLEKVFKQINRLEFIQPKESKPTLQPETKIKTVTH